MYFYFRSVFDPDFFVAVIAAFKLDESRLVTEGTTMSVVVAVSRALGLRATPTSVTRLTGKRVFAEAIAQYSKLMDRRLREYGGTLRAEKTHTHMHTYRNYKLYWCRGLPKVSKSHRECHCGDG